MINRKSPELGNGVIETCYNRRQLRKHPTWDYPTPLEIRQRHDQGRLRVRAEPDTRRYLTGQNPAPLQVGLTGVPRRELDSLIDQIADDWQMVADRDLTRHIGRPCLRPSARGIGQLEYHHRVPAALL
ncbi:hypothetical protein [Streptomyces aurantiogriseus]